ncbi:ABC transporter A family member 7 [Linum grandiflorum]
MNIWYNSTPKDDGGGGAFKLLRVPRIVNLASNAYLQLLKGPSARMELEFVKEMPRSPTDFRLDLASVLGTLFFTWVILQLFPVALTSLVYEKQQRLRIMMKMHGLGDGPYWVISYAYFFAISLLYMFVFVAFGSVIGLKFFTLNDYSIQFVFYFIYINLQISVAFLVAAFFSNVKTATVVAYICVFGTGLLGGFFYQSFLEDTSFPRGLLILLELYPGFSLYRGLYEFSQYSNTGVTNGTHGMRWENLNDSGNGMKELFTIMTVEWIVVLFVAYYIDQVLSSGKSPLFFFKNFGKKPSASLRMPSLRRQGSKVFVNLEKPDVVQEREKVEQLLLEPNTSHAIVCDNLRKVYPGRDGNQAKLAVKGLSLALPRGECFGMLGPNGAGKTSFISMMIGLTKPTSGTAYVQGLDIRTHMDYVYTNIGVCPQHDLLWETLTGREHLLFYGRLKNLKGSVLTRAVEDSLRSLNLFNGGVADKQAGKYSGGMKRRLSVAISLIGDPKVVYMDEPSTGLDPASRSCLWNVLKRAKQDRAIILTTHSMEEAEALCDRLGIFVDGGLQCIGNPKELKARYGETYVFTMTTGADNEKEVEKMVRELSPSAERTYHLTGTQKFEMPKQEVRIADVFRAVEIAKSEFPVFAWGISDTTLEDVFIKVATAA